MLLVFQHMAVYSQKDEVICMKLDGNSSLDRRLSERIFAPGRRKFVSKTGLIFGTSPTVSL